MATLPTIYVQLLQYVVTVQCKILIWENFDELYMTSYTMTLPKILIPLQLGICQCCHCQYFREREFAPSECYAVRYTGNIYCILIFSYSFFITTCILICKPHSNHIMSHSNHIVHPIATISCPIHTCIYDTFNTTSSSYHILIYWCSFSNE